MSEYNSADKEQVEQAEKKRKNERDQELDDLRTLIKSPAGERFFRRFFKLGRMFDCSYTGDNDTFYHEGRRNFALLILGEVTEVASKEELVKLMFNQ